MWDLWQEVSSEFLGVDSRCNAKDSNEALPSKSRVNKQALVHYDLGLSSKSVLLNFCVLFCCDSFRSNSANNNKDREGEDKGEKVKEAATRSLEVSKEAIEESAKLAGGVIGEAVHKTAEKVTKQTSHDEM